MSVVQCPLLSELLIVISVAIFVSSLLKNGKRLSLPRDLRVAYYYLYGNSLSCKIDCYESVYDSNDSKNNSLIDNALLEMVKHT